MVDRIHHPVECDGLVAEPRFGARLGETERASLAASARPTPRDAEEREARGRELRAAHDLARRRRRQAILASAAAAIILALGGAATWMFRELAATRESPVARLISFPLRSCLRHPSFQIV